MLASSVGCVVFERGREGGAPFLWGGRGPLRVSFGVWDAASGASAISVSEPFVNSTFWLAPLLVEDMGWYIGRG